MVEGVTFHAYATRLKHQGNRMIARPSIDGVGHRNSLPVGKGLCVTRMGELRMYLVARM